ncbi:DUF2000 domain-containing protein [Chitinophaga oryzae]|uniref:DUF2000 domain-containing protein n=1 Tax=Chitinophaga oryzae TaxID=2725414 RepID=A0ABX6LQN5_9BACT|nr:DUF2000 domain-containing protein [Chitinophaga oryzae]QJB42433.1 DUF2000 domain-containing protein [Chitinophaga oryzae]
MDSTNTTIESKKCVLIIDSTQPTGIIANTSSVLSITLGQQLGNIIGQDVYDKQGEKHLGITQMPIPILGASPEKIKEIRRHFLSLLIEDIVIVDFSDIAQKSRTYDHYENIMRTTTENDIRYIGIAVYGDKKVINKATGNLSLIR